MASTFSNAACAFFRACPNIVFIAKWCGSQFYRDHTSVTKRELLPRQVLSLMESMRTIHESVPGGRLTFVIAKEHTPDKNIGGGGDQWTFSSVDLFNEKLGAVEENMRQHPLTQDGNWFLELAIDYCNRCNTAVNAVVGKSATKQSKSVHYDDIKYDVNHHDDTTSSARHNLVNQVSSYWMYINEKLLQPSFSELATLGQAAFKTWYSEKLVAHKFVDNDSASRERDLFFSEIEKLESLLRLVYRQLYPMFDDGNRNDDGLSTIDKFRQFLTSKNIIWHADARFRSLLVNHYDLNSIVPLFKRRRNSQVDFILFLAMLAPQLLLAVAQFKVFMKLDRYHDAAVLERKLMLYYQTRCVAPQNEQSQLCSSLVELVRQMEEQRELINSRDAFERKSGASTTLINSLMPGNKARYVSATVDLAESNRLFDSLKADFSSDIKKLRDQLNASISNRSKALIHYKLEQFEGVVHVIKNDFAKLKNIQAALLPAPASSAKELAGKDADEYTRQYLTLVRDAHCLLDDLEKKEKDLDVSRAMRFDASAVFVQSVRDFQTILGYWIEQNLYPLTTRRGFGIVWPSGWNNADYALDNLSRRLIKNAGTEGMFIHRISNLWRYLHSILNKPDGTVPDLAVIAQRSLESEDKAPACAPNMSLFTGAKSAYCAGIVDPLSYAEHAAALRLNVHRINDEIGHSSAWFAQYAATASQPQLNVVDSAALDSFRANSGVLRCEIKPNTIKIDGKKYNQDVLTCMRVNAKPHNAVLLEGTTNFDAGLAKYIRDKIVAVYAKHLKDDGKFVNVKVTHTYSKMPKFPKQKYLNVRLDIDIGKDPSTYKDQYIVVYLVLEGFTLDSHMDDLRRAILNKKVNKPNAPTKVVVGDGGGASEMDALLPKSPPPYPLKHIHRNEWILKPILNVVGSEIDKALKLAPSSSAIHPLTTHTEKAH